MNGERVARVEPAVHVRSSTEGRHAAPSPRVTQDARPADSFRALLNRSVAREQRRRDGR